LERLFTEEALRWLSEPDSSPFAPRVRNWLDAGLRARPMRLFYWEKRIKIDYSNDSVFIETLPLSAY
jgi:hypothetical protein